MAVASASLRYVMLMIKDVPKAALELKNTVGVVDHGFFIDMSSAVIVATADGIVVKTP